MMPKHIHEHASFISLSTRLENQKAKKKKGRANKKLEKAHSMVMAKTLFITLNAKKKTVNIKKNSN